MNFRLKLITTATLLCLAPGLTIFCAMKAVQAVQLFQQTRHKTLTGDVGTIRPWMTIPYISKVYHVPESYLLQWLHISDPRSVRNVTLHSLAGRFQRRGGWAIFLTRFLITALGSVTNLVAGTELFPFRSFLLSDFPGEALGAVIPLALGFVFSASWEAVGDILGAISLFALGVVCVVVLTHRLLRYLKREKVMRQQEKLQLGEAQLLGQKKSGS